MLATRTALTATAVIGAASVGGAFAAFSTFVMPALDRLRPVDSIVAMQAINRAPPTPLFMIPLFGTALLGCWSRRPGGGGSTVRSASPRSPAPCSTSSGWWA